MTTPTLAPPPSSAGAAPRRAPPDRRARPDLRAPTSPRAPDPRPWTLHALTFPGLGFQPGFVLGRGRRFPLPSVGARLPAVGPQAPFRPRTPVRGRPALGLPGDGPRVAAARPRLVTCRLRRARGAGRSLPCYSLSVIWRVRVVFAEISVTWGVAALPRLCRRDGSKGSIGRRRLLGSAPPDRPRGGAAPGLVATTTPARSSSQAPRPCRRRPTGHPGPRRRPRQCPRPRPRRPRP